MQNYVILITYQGLPHSVKVFNVDRKEALAKFSYLKKDYLEKDGFNVSFWENAGLPNKPEEFIVTGF